MCRYAISGILTLIPQDISGTDPPPPPPVLGGGGTIKALELYKVISGHGGNRMLSLPWMSTAYFSSLCGGRVQ